MTAVLGFDTATDATVVGLTRPGREPLELWHTPAAGERPGHAQQLLPLAHQILEQAGIGFVDLVRIGVGVGPGTFTGLRIGVATARALAQSSGAELAGVSTLQALAAGVLGPNADGRPVAADGVGASGGAIGSHQGPVLSVLDARRGEAFVAAYASGGRHGPHVLRAAAAVAPDGLGDWLTMAPGPWLAVGEGAVRFRALLEAADAAVPPDGSAQHRVSAVSVCELAITAEPVDRDALIPDYVRVPDAEMRKPF